MDEFFRQLYATLFARAPKNVDPKVILDAAHRVARELRELCTRPAVGWSGAEHSTIGRMYSESMLGRDVRVVAQVANMEKPFLLKIPTNDDDGGSREQRLATALELVDERSDQIATLAILGEQLVQKIVDLRRSAGAVEFLGRVLTMPRSIDNNREDFILQVFDAQRTTSALDLLGATTAEREWADSRLAELRNAGQSPIDYLERQLVENLHVVGLAEYPVLRQLLRFPILQSVSGGRLLDHTAGKLHLIVIGRPGSGKKLIGLAAACLNSRCGELSGAKITAAGLIGASYPTDSGWRSMPGIIPRADGGVVCLQDAHTVRPARLEDLAPVLQDLIEDGVLRDSVAGGVRREVDVGLVIDLNRKAQADSTAHGQPEAAILRNNPLISRVDLVAEIPPDAERSWNVGGHLYGVLDGGKGRLYDQAWVRESRLLVAALRDRHRQVVVGSDVREEMLRIHEQIKKDNEEWIARTPEAGDIPARLSISFMRLVIASARAHDRSRADMEDLCEAQRFVNLKLTYLKLRVREPTRTPARDARRRDDFYRERAGRMVKPVDLAREWKEETDEEMSVKTFERDLKERLARWVRRGVYLLPPHDLASSATARHSDIQTSTQGEERCEPSDLASPAASPDVGMSECRVIQIKPVLRESTRKKQRKNKPQPRRPRGADER